MTWANILVVEGESIAAQDLQEHLVALGYGVSAVVSTAEAALKAELSSRPDLVLVAMRLADGSDGIETGQALRERIDVPIVYLTAYADAATLEHAQKTQPYGYIIKPFQKRDVHVVIEMALYRHRVEHQLRDRERWLSAVLKCVGEGVIATDTRGTVRFLNDAAESLLGRTSAETIDHPLSEIYPARPSAPAALPETVAQALQRRATVRRTKAPLALPNAPLLLVNECAAPIIDERGMTVGAILVLQLAEATDQE
ncbi:MAG: response regulator [Myxococcaceae bacterium]|nr:response regulator [Myxococcaceae bacterium]